MDTLTVNGTETEMTVGAELAELSLADLDQRRFYLTEPEPELIQGLWDNETEGYTRYRVELRFMEKVCGGVPVRPDIVEAWLRTRLKVSGEDELRHAVTRHLEESGVVIGLDDISFDDMVAASKKVAAESNVQTFMRDSKGLFLPGRYVKAMLRESCNIRFPWDGGKNKWGPSKKTPKSELADTAFCQELRIPLGRDDPDGRQLFAGHVTGPQGKRSILTLYDYAWQPSVTFTILSLEDRVTADQWKQILIHAQHIGLGAVRSQSFGTFKVVAFDRL